MMNRTIEAGRQNLFALERTIIRDHTLMPGEWYGGQVHLEAALGQSGLGPKTYSISVLVGLDAHSIEITEAAEAR
jgi:hypothetical protein